MPSIQVQPDALQSGAGTQAAVAAHVRELGGRLKSATASAASAAGDGNAAGAISSFGAGWASALDYLAETVAARGARALNTKIPVNRMIAASSAR